jgi:hypothetical protein
MLHIICLSMYCTYDSSSAVPGPVTNLMARDLNSTSILVTFSPPSSPNGIITRYEVRYVESPEGTSTAGGEQVIIITESLDMSVFEVNITGLAAFTRYLISVLASTSIGFGTPENRTVITDPTASSPPTNVRAEATSSQNISVTWGYPTDPRGEIAGYLIRYSSSSASATLNLTLPSLNNQSEQTQVIGGLVPFTNYSITVRAYSFGDDIIHTGMESAVVVVRTLEAGMQNENLDSELSC